ncbi:hypothetical protein EV651_1197 [Kribbella sp. VKM Ac-2571]|uniref:hypothetical protein n=1 Tax=Kribbella sp. VKM Ac-2571 TaxID=2512222 RepID=UPI00105CCF93|nr:hypothetical protein [Kribbella sp. VKM Ac-2571]TDO51080.1 hypothetical protein EV651_1197 [Kribbella sp. VKM Ac-2571]
MDLDQFLDKPVLRILRNAVATIRALGTVVATLAAALVVLYLSLWKDKVSPSVAIVIAAALLALLAFIVGFWLYLQHVYNPAYYEILEFESLLIVQPLGDHHRYQYERRQRVRANRDEVRLIEFNAHWTGAGTRDKLHVESLISDHALLDGRRQEEDGRVRRWIYPRRAISKGREVEVGIRQIHEDDIERQLPYFRESGSQHRTRKMSVTVRFNREEDPQALGEVKGMEWNTNLPPRHSKPVDYHDPIRRVNQDAKTVDYLLVVEKPKLFHSYGIVWQWPPDES